VDFLSLLILQSITVSHCIERQVTFLSDKNSMYLCIVVLLYK